jgi:uncharacterized membrane protein YhaH (DUF805 family)
MRIILILFGIAMLLPGLCVFATALSDAKSRGADEYNLMFIAIGGLAALAGFLLIRSR